MADVEILLINASKRRAVPALPRTRVGLTDLTFCIEGKMEYVLNGQAVTLRAGDCIVIPSGATRERLDTPVENEYASINAIIKGERLPKISGVVRGCVSTDIVYLLTLFRKCFFSASPHAKEKCTLLFEFLYTEVAEALLHDEHPTVKRAKQYVKEHLCERMTLGDIAESVHTAPEYLCALFKRESGTSVMSYVREQRIEQAKQTIILGGSSMATVAERCGFTDYASFSHCFSRVTGLSPMQFKRSIGK